MTRTTRKQTVKLGIFVVSVAAILVFALFLIGGLRLWRPVDTYHIVTGEVSGIELESEVTFRGVKVGRVAAIELDHSDFDHVIIDLEIDPDIEIPSDAQAYFERVGLTGERAIDITGGSLAEGHLAPGSIIPRGETRLESLATRASEVATELPTLLGEMTATVRDISVRVEAIDPEWVRGLVEAVEPARVRAIVTNSQRATKTLATTSRRLDQVVIEGRADIRTITQDVDVVAAKASTALDHADDAMKQVSGLVGDADEIVKTNADDIRVAVENFRRAAHEAKALIEALRERPSLLLRSKPHRRRKSR